MLKLMKRRTVEQESARILSELAGGIETTVKNFCAYEVDARLTVAITTKRRLKANDIQAISDSFTGTLCSVGDFEITLDKVEDGSSLQWGQTLLFKLRARHTTP